MLKFTNLHWSMLWNWKQPKRIHGRIPVYFIIYYYILIQVLSKVNNQLSRRNINLLHFYQAYDDMTDLIPSINRIFYSILLLTFTIHFELIFCYANVLIFTEMEFQCKQGVFLQLSDGFLQVLFMCIFSTSVVNLPEQVKNLVFRIPLWYYTMHFKYAK